MFVTKRNGSKEDLNINEIHEACQAAIEGFANCSLSELETDSHLQLYDGIKTSDIQQILIKTAADKVSVEVPEWSYVAARLALRSLHRNVHYASFEDYLHAAKDIVDPRLFTDFNLKLIDDTIDYSRDYLFKYLGLQILMDRYLLRNKSGDIIETPQLLFMRVACGLALAEKDDVKTDWAIRFYEELSSFRVMCATSTLFNSGTNHPQLSSCFLLNMEDSLEGIFEALKEAAMYSKYSGGIGMDMTPLRPSGSLIKGTGGKSSGVVPYAKLVNDMVNAFDQGGRRKGSAAIYLEPWHGDIEDFLDLKTSSGDERMRAHDLFPAMWIPDLFMERVEKEEMWSLFNPAETGLHDLYGEDFEREYLRLESEKKYIRQVPATRIWRKIITNLYETGTYWVNFKDEVNRRYAQRNSGVVRSSNLCSEVVLRANQAEGISAVCNLASINLSRVESPAALMETTAIAVRMLDNVIDIGYIPHERGEAFNQEDRAVGLGVMGYAEFLYQSDIRFASEEHIAAADRLFEHISYAAIRASAALARERGAYPTFDQSSWVNGELPIDSARNSATTLDWEEVREEVKGGMRNSCLMAIAPTATISDITGTTPCIELPHLNAYERENMSGSFTVVSPLLRYKEDPETASSVDMKWVILAAAARQKWIDQSQSLNLMVPEGTPGREISALYFLAWKLGVKTTYYLRTQSRTLKICSLDNPDCESCQ